jgi:hypothetical protein
LVVPSAFEVIGKAFKLTPTELRVLLATVEVGGAPETAGVLGVVLTTIRTHLGLQRQVLRGRRISSNLSRPCDAVSRLIAIGNVEGVQAE